jgi:hypothetical protein
MMLYRQGQALSWKEVGMLKILLETRHLCPGQVVSGNQNVRKAHLAPATVENSALETETLLDLLDRAIPQSDHISAKHTVLDELLQSAVLETSGHSILPRQGRTKALGVRLLGGHHRNSLLRDRRGLIRGKKRLFRPHFFTSAMVVPPVLFVRSETHLPGTRAVLTTHGK